MTDSSFLSDLAAARAAASRRAPDGHRMTGFRWAEVGAALWLFPAALPASPGLQPLSVTRNLPGIARDRAAAWRLASAVRQDLWRALQRVPGLLPVVRIARDTTDATQITAAALVPRHLAGTAVTTALEGLFTPARTDNWTRHAGVRNNKTSGETA